MSYPQDPNDPYGRPGYGQRYATGGYPQAYPGGPMRPKDGPGLAVGALICSIVGPFLCIVVTIAGIVMGHIAYGKAKRGEAEGRGLAMAAFIVGYVGIVLGIAAMIVVFSLAAAHGAFR